MSKGIIKLITFLYLPAGTKGDILCSHSNIAALELQVLDSCARMLVSVQAYRHRTKGMFYMQMHTQCECVSNPFG